MSGMKRWAACAVLALALAVRHRAIHAATRAAELDRLVTLRTAELALKAVDEETGARLGPTGGAVQVNRLGVLDADEDLEDA